MFQRSVQLPENRSFFLFGARGTGKSTLLREMFPKEFTFTINLLDLATETRLARNPELFEREILSLPELIVSAGSDQVAVPLKI